MSDFWKTSLKFRWRKLLIVLIYNFKNYKHIHTYAGWFFTKVLRKIAKCNSCRKLTCLCWRAVCTLWKITKFEELHCITPYHAKLLAPRHYSKNINLNKNNSNINMQYQQTGGFIRRQINITPVFLLVLLWHKSFVWDSVSVCCSQVGVS